jgi:hypothetical protein
MIAGTGFSGHAARDWTRVIAQTDRIDLAAGTVQARAAHGDAVDGQLVA